MAVLTKSQAPSSHWYTIDGIPVHQMDTAKGGTRSTDLRDARKYGLFPSVTGIIGIFAKPQLETWKLKQVAIASLKNQINPGESEDYWVKRVIEAAFAQVDRAADFGTLCHLAIEQFVKFAKPIPQDLLIYLEPVLEILHRPGMKISSSEATIVSQRYGYAGTKDYSFTFGRNGIGVIDFKTRKTVKDKEVEAYDYQDMQIAAYAAKYWADVEGTTEEEILKRCVGANVFISSTEPGRVEIVKYSAEELTNAFSLFTSACRMWQHIKGYDPRNAERNPVPTSVPPSLPSDIPDDVSSPETPQSPREVPSDAKETPSGTEDIQQIFDDGDANRAKKSATKKATPTKKAKPEKVVNPSCKACGGSGKSSSGKDCVPCSKTKEAKEPKPKAKEPYLLSFGKHKGKQLDQIPREYLEWVVQQKQYKADAELMAAIEAELRLK